MQRQTWFSIWYVIVALIGVLWVRDLWTTMNQVEPIAYSQFEQDLKAGSRGSPPRRAGATAKKPSARSIARCARFPRRLFPLR